MFDLGCSVTVQNGYLRIKLSFCDTALSGSNIGVEIAQILIGNGELSENVVVSSLAVAAPLPSSSYSDFIALAGLYVSKLWRRACEWGEQAAITEI